MLTSNLPRISLGFFPTPVHELPRLSDALGGPRIWVKRDDQTGLATGGNKVRKLEFSMADAIQQGADTVVTIGAVQSNHIRQTAAAAARLGMRAVLIVSGYPPEHVTGNMLLNYLLGAEVVFTGEKTDITEEVMQAEREKGHKPYLIPVGASNAIGALGLVAGMEELVGQVKENGWHFDWLVLPTGSAGTQAGLCVGARALGYDIKIAGINVSRSTAETQAKVAPIAEACARLIGREMKFPLEEIISFDGYLGEGYSKMGPPEREAIDMAASLDALLLDPVYTGRAMAGLIDLIRKGVIGKDEQVLFWHTGGAAAMPAYAEKLMAGR